MRRAEQCEEELAELAAQHVEAASDLTEERQTFAVEQQQWRQYRGRQL
jgi:hypothetical protein